MSVNQVRDESDLQRAVVSAIHEHWVLFLVEGIILVILGALAILVPPLATITFTISSLVTCPFVAGRSAASRFKAS